MLKKATNLVKNRSSTKVDHSADYTEFKNLDGFEFLIIDFPGLINLCSLSDLRSLCSLRALDSLCSPNFLKNFLIQMI